ncbi:hypothetical protein EYF80_034373 [Liparis tanakae]|uniref:Uncharacterized protein n=1 Tax=Liparis tanakae TaxID=230148 RepID=A0A4Z2GRM0_9TELE|nr:hypothetical protein EYF80_034373 [Liparis tanakae]
MPTVMDPIEERTASSSSPPPSTLPFHIREEEARAADPPLQLQVAFLQLADLLDELADVIQVTQARAQRVGARLLRLHEQRSLFSDQTSRGIVLWGRRTSFARTRTNRRPVRSDKQLGAGLMCVGPDTERPFVPNNNGDY